MSFDLAELYREACRDPWRNVEVFKAQGIYSNAMVRSADGSMLWKKGYILGS